MKPAFLSPVPLTLRQKRPPSLPAHAPLLLPRTLARAALNPPAPTNPLPAPQSRVASSTPAPVPHLPSEAAYTALYNASISDPDAFWREIAAPFAWRDIAPDDPVLTANFDPRVAPVDVQFFPHRRTNVCHNALDRHIAAGHANRVAFHCVGNEPATTRDVTYGELHDTVQRLANVLKSLGVRKGHVVILYMPMIPELPAAMLACARIGAVHSVVFAGFSAEALAGRILDSSAAVLVVADAAARASKLVPLKAIADAACDIAAAAGHTVQHQLVCRHAAADVSMTAARDLDWRRALATASPVCEPEWLPAEHPLFVLYTSGSTGKPKGVVHTTAGYMIWAATTFKYTFDHHAGDVFFSTSDCGWIAGHTFVTYGPLLNGATQVLYEGVPTYPSPARLWQMVEAYGVTQLYTAPTVIRALKGAAPPPSTVARPEPTSADWVRAHDTSSLRVLGTVGEPINPEAWRWYHDVVGNSRCAIVDTWWQTETAGSSVLALPVPGLPKKPGCAMMPFFGIQLAILNEAGEELPGSAEGFLVIKGPWPSTLRTVYGDHARMEETYFSRFPGYYMTGDGARRDEDGHYWLTGRVDDILNVSGHRIGTAEVESAIVTHEAVAEAAVVGVPHHVKGESLYAYVSLRSGLQPSDELHTSIKSCVRKEIGPFASPDTIHWAPALPKTRSGKIMRRILRKIAASGLETNVDELGDTSTLTDPNVIAILLDSYGK